jgi:hypothetical protein
MHIMPVSDWRGQIGSIGLVVRVPENELQSNELLANVEVRLKRGDIRRAPVSVF